VKPESYRWALVAALGIVGMLNYLDRQVIFSLFPLLRSDLHLADWQLGMAGSAFLWIYAFMSPFGGYVADRYGRRRVIIFSLLVWSSVTLLTGLARSYGALFMARSMMGLSEACYLPAALALITCYHGAPTRSRAVGFHMAGLALGMVLGGVGGGWMGGLWGWRAPFFLLGAIGIAYCAVLTPFLRPDPPADREAAPGFLPAVRQVIGLRGFPVFAAVFAAKGVSDWLVYTWMPLYLYERFGMSLANAGFSATFYMQAATMAGIVAGGALGDWWGMRAASGRAWTQAAGLTVAAPFLVLGGFTRTSAVLLAGLAVYGLARGFFDSNAMPVLAQMAPQHLRATGYGLLNFGSTIAGGLIATAGGFLKASIGIGVLMQVAGVLLLVGAVALWRLRFALVELDRDWIVPADGMKKCALP
jgi:MFS family permease